MSWRQFAGMATPKDGDKDRPKPLKPEMEHYAGENIPYRGVEDHGVTAHTKPHDVPDFTEESPGVVYLKPVDEMDPIPVRVVTAGSQEWKRWRVDSYDIPMGTAVQVAGRNERRYRISIRNQTASGFFYIAPVQEQANLTFGYGVTSRQEISLTSTEPVWVYADSVDSICNILEEYSVEE